MVDPNVAINVDLEIEQGTEARFRLSIPIGSTGLDYTDVSESEFKVFLDGTAVISKTLSASDLVASDDGENIYVDLVLVPSDSSALSASKSFGFATGILYYFEWYATVDGAYRKKSYGEFTINDSLGA